MPIEPSSVAQGILAANIAGWADAITDADTISVESTAETEWHSVFFCSAPANEQSNLKYPKLVINFPSWTGAALSNKIAASNHLAATKIGPAILGEITLSPDGQVGHVSEWFGGGLLSNDDLRDPAAMFELGSLYRRLHQSGSTWFDSSAECLRQESRLSSDERAADWAQCTWVLAWLFEQVPTANRLDLTSQGVDWDFIASEIAELPKDPLLPMTPVVTVHGDSHAGNIMKDQEGRLRLIDFDMTARGPAGSEFGFITLMLFRCGFAEELVVSLDVQRAFARGYLSASSDDFAQSYLDGAVDQEAIEREIAFLRTMHSWTYYGLLKMGLLCAVLMANEGHVAKRAIMRARGPVLLHREFLMAAKSCIQRSAQGDAKMADDILVRGLFFATQDSAQWKAIDASGAVAP